MTKEERLLAHILAEVLRLQRWASGSFDNAHRMYALQMGFEQIIDEITERNVDSETQQKMEELLSAAEAGEVPSGGMEIKDMLRSNDIDEMDARSVMKHCILGSYLVDGVRAFVEAKGSPFASLKRTTFDERQWLGALHYLELFDLTDGVKKKLHAAYSPGIPRKGEVVVPEAGCTMRVVRVEYVASRSDERDGPIRISLTPYVMLEAIGDD